LNNHQPQLSLACRACTDPSQFGHPNTLRAAEGNVRDDAATVHEDRHDATEFKATGDESLLQFPSQPAILRAAEALETLQLA